MDKLTPYIIAFTPHGGIFEVKNKSIFRRKRLFGIIEIITGGNRDWTYIGMKENLVGYAAKTQRILPVE